MDIVKKTRKEHRKYVLMNAEKALASENYDLVISCYEKAIEISKDLNEKKKAREYDRIIKELG